MANNKLLWSDPMTLNLSDSILSGYNGISYTQPSMDKRNLSASRMVTIANYIINSKAAASTARAKYLEAVGKGEDWSGVLWGTDAPSDGQHASSYIFPDYRNNAGECDASVFVKGAKLERDPLLRMYDDLSKFYMLDYIAENDPSKPPPSDDDPDPHGPDPDIPYPPDEPLDDPTPPGRAKRVVETSRNDIVCQFNKAVGLDLFGGVPYDFYDVIDYSCTDEWIGCSFMAHGDVYASCGKTDDDDHGSSFAKSVNKRYSFSGRIGRDSDGRARFYVSRGDISRALGLANRLPLSFAKARDWANNNIRCAVSVGCSAVRLDTVYV